MRVILGKAHKIIILGYIFIPLSLIYTSSYIVKYPNYSIKIILACLAIFFIYKYKYFSHYILLLSLLMQHYTSGVSFQVSSVNIYFQDLLITFIYISFIPNLLKDTNFLKIIKYNGSIILLVAICLIPTLTGILNNYRLEAVLRNSLLSYFLLSLYIYIYLIRDINSIIRILDFIVIISFLSGIYHVICISLGFTFESGMSNVVTTQGVISRGYGIGSAWPFYSISIIYLIARTTYYDKKNLIHNYKNILILFFLVITMITYIRTYYIATPIAVASVITFKWRQNFSKFIMAPFVLLIVIGSLYFIFPSSVLIAYERMASIFISNRSTSEASKSFRNRIEQLEIAKNYNKNTIIFGKGAGHFTTDFNNVSIQDPKKNRLYILLTHNSYAHIYVVGGLFLLLTLIPFYLFFYLVIIRSHLKTSDNLVKDISVALSAIFIFIFIISFASGATLFGPYYVFIIPWLGIAYSLKNLAPKSYKRKLFN